MKFENAAIVMTDTDTGKPYARPLSAWELNLVLSQLQALDGGALKAREIAPFVMRTVGISQEAAERIANKQSGLHYVARQGAKAFEDMAHAHTVNGTGKIPGGLQQIAKGKPACNHEWIASEGRTASGVLCRKCGDYDGPATECQHKAHYHGRCQVCGHKVNGGDNGQ